MCYWQVFPSSGRLKSHTNKLKYQTTKGGGHCSVLMLTSHVENENIIFHFHLSKKCSIRTELFIGFFGPGFLGLLRRMHLTGQGNL